MNMKKSAAGGKKSAAASSSTPKKNGSATPDCELHLHLTLPFHFPLLIQTTAVKSGRVTKRAPKTPSKLKRVDSEDEED